MGSQEKLIWGQLIDLLGVLGLIYLGLLVFETWVLGRRTLGSGLQTGTLGGRGGGVGECVFWCLPEKSGACST